MIGGGITNTLDLGGGQKIQDYLAGAGVSNQGPGGGTLYTQGGDFDGTPQGIHNRTKFNPRPVIDTSSQQYQDLFEKYRPGIDGTYTPGFGSGFGPVTQNRTYLDLPSMQDMTALGYYDASPMTREDKRPMMAQFMNNLYRQPASGDANLGFGSVQNPLGPAGPGVGGVIPETGQQLLLPEGYNPSFNPGDTSEVGGPKIFDPRDEIIQKMPFDQRPGGSNFSPFDVPLFGEQEDTGVGMPVGTDTTDSFGIGSNPIMNNPIAPMPSMPTAPNTQPGHSHDDLLSGIGKLFEQYFPQQNTQQINQPATQPIFDAAGNSAPQQTQSNQVFGNMITPNFGGGY